MAILAGAGGVSGRSTTTRADQWVCLSTLYLWDMNRLAAGRLCCELFLTTGLFGPMLVACQSFHGSSLIRRVSSEVLVAGHLPGLPVVVRLSVPPHIWVRLSRSVHVLGLLLA